MPEPPRPSASEVLRHNLLILVGLPSQISQAEGRGGLGITSSSEEVYELVL